MNTPAGVFKRCAVCGTVWQTRAAFLSDPAIAVTGYQADLVDMRRGFYLFNHNRPGCYASLAFGADAFADLYAGPRHEAVLTGGAECDGHCLTVEDLGDCEAPCRGAYYRKLLRVLVACCNGTED